MFSHLNYAAGWMESISSRLGTLHEATKVRSVEDSLHSIADAFESRCLLFLLLTLLIQKTLLCCCLTFLALCKFIKTLLFNEKNLKKCMVLRIKCSKSAMTKQKFLDYKFTCWASIAACWANLCCCSSNSFWRCWRSCCSLKKKDMIMQTIV